MTMQQPYEHHEQYQASPYGAIIAVFESRDAANRAAKALFDAGFSRDAVRISSADLETGATVERPREEQGFWESIKDFFTGEQGPSEEEWYTEQERAGRFIVSVQCRQDNCDEARSILARHGAVDFESQQMGDEDRSRVLQLMEERLQARRQRRQVGEVEVTKEVREEERTLNVPVEHEEAYVERRAVDRPAGRADFDTIGQGRTIRIPLYAESVDIERQPYVYEEVDVGKDTVTEQRQMRETVRREVADVEREGDVDMRGEEPRQQPPTQP